MRVGGRGRPGPARLVTQSRRLAGACAASPRGPVGGAPGAVCWVQPALRLPFMPGLGRCWGDVALREVFSASGTFLEWPGINPQPTAAAATVPGGRPLRPGPGAQGRKPPVSSTPDECLAQRWPSWPCLQAERRNKGHRGPTSTSSPFCPVHLFQEVLGTPRGLPLAHHLQTHSPTCWKPPLPAWWRRGLPMTQRAGLG